MIELGVVSAIVVVLCASAAGLALTPWPVLLIVGVLTVAVGLLGGVPAGIVYHLQLYRALAPRRALPDGWWRRPHAHHAALNSKERARVMPWFYLGAAGFLVILLGCLIAGVAAARSS